MPHSWQKALDKYEYPVRLDGFEDRQIYPGWFKCDTDNGDRSSTMKFEERFRKLAPHHLEAWYEVVFWKMYSQGRRDYVTRNAIANIRNQR